MNTKRLLDVINWNLTGAKRALRRETAGLIVAPSCIIIANCATYWINKQPVDEGLHIAASITWFALFFLGANWGARFCFNMNTKQNALNYMMLPATNGEKYLANMFMQTIVRMVETAIAIIMADLIQAAICLSVGIDIQSYTMAIIDVASEVTDGPLTIKAFILASIINLHASMVLGGCLFRKNHLILTGISLFALMVATTGILCGISYLVDGWAEANDCAIYVDFTISKDAIAWIACTVITMVSALFYWLSFKIFCRRQLITSRFFN